MAWILFFTKLRRALKHWPESHSKCTSWCKEDLNPNHLYSLYQLLIVPNSLNTTPNILAEKAA
eukprot:scaffold21423_cov21-Tisochrysis_lutea.AAC.1